MQLFCFKFANNIVSSEGVMNEFTERLDELLKENNLSRLNLANLINITSTTLNGYFNKGYFPQIDIAINIANYFNCSLDYLFALDENIKNTNKNNKPFFENFESILKERELSIAKAMKSLGMSEYNYFRWKNGKYPKTANLLIIAKTFDVSLDWLVGNKVKEKE